MLAIIAPIKFLTKSIYSLRSSQRPTASVRVKAENFSTYQFLEAKLVLLDSEIRSSLQRCTFSSGYRIRLILPPPHKLA